MLRRRGARLGKQAAGELLTLARVAALFPLGLVEAAPSVGHPCHDDIHDTPIILIHGYFHNRSGWMAFDRQLRYSGFTSVHTVSYLRAGLGVPGLAARLAEQVSEVRAATGASKVHLVAHSLGGIVMRWYIQELGGDSVVDTAITLGTPHGGLRWTLAGLDPTLRDLRPGSTVLQQLDSGARPGPVRWFAYYSDLDLMVGSKSAQLLPPALNATNVLAQGDGHLAMMLSIQVARSVAANLERRPAPELDEMSGLL